MNFMKTRRALLLAPAVALLMAGCATVSLDEPTTAPIVDVRTTGPTAQAALPDPRAVTPVDTQAGRGLDPFSDPNHPLSRRSVFFDFDSYVVKSEFQPVVETHGKFLGSNRDRRIVIEGHTDERGGREYNLALGQRRAEAVKQRLLLLGASDAQIETVSFGKEKPRAVGSNEEAWAQNRRADIVYR
jgi:peptidoglycan-associated lipoprotein